MNTLLFERVHDLLILVHGTENPRDVEWDVYLRFVQETQRGPAPLSGLLVCTWGGAPNAVQRRAVLAAAEPRPSATCVCTDSVIARGVVTAMSWLNRQPMYAFRLDEVDLALDTLKVPREQRCEALAVLARLQAQLAPRR